MTEKLAGTHKRVKEMEVMVSDVISETDDTTTLFLFTGNDILDYMPGHFITIDPHQFPALERWTNYLEDMKGQREKPRAYSLASAPHERYLAITVKEEEYRTGDTLYPPLLSPILAKRTQRGARMVITGFVGPYTLTDELRQTTDVVVHICAGSGVVPSWSIIKASLVNDEQTRHILIYSNKYLQDTIYLDQMRQLETQYHERFKVHYLYTRQSELPAFSPNISLGRVNQQAVEQALAGISNPLVYVCGPAISLHDKKTAKAESRILAPKFMESVLDQLKTIGVDPKRIKHESWG